MSGIITNAGQAAQAALVREKRLKEHIVALSRALATYRKQHDCAYAPSGICTCVNCVLTRNLLEKSTELP